MNFSYAAVDCMTPVSMDAAGAGFVAVLAAATKTTLRRISSFMLKD